MSSIKLNSSGGGSVSLSAANSSTDVTVKFPSSNSTIGQALVASNTSGELDWEDVPNDSSKVLFHGFITPASGGAFAFSVDQTSPNLDPYTTGGWMLLPFDWSQASSGSQTAVTPVDTHNGYDSTLHYYVVPTSGYYNIRLSLTMFADFNHGNAFRTIIPTITVKNSINVLKKQFLGYRPVDTTGRTSAVIFDAEVNGSMQLSANDRIYFEITGFGLSDATNPDGILAFLNNTNWQSNTFARVERVRGV